MFEKKQKPEAGEEEKQEVEKGEEQKSIVKSGFFGLKKLLKRKEPDPAPLQVEEEAPTTEASLTPDAEPITGILPTDTDIVEAHDSTLLTEETKEVSTPSVLAEIKTENAENVQTVASPETSDTSSLPPVEEEIFHIPYAPIKVESQIMSSVPENVPREGEDSLQEETGKLDPPDVSLQESADTQADQLLAAIENQLTNEKPSKREKSSKSKKIKAKKQKKNSLVDEIIKTAEATGSPQITIADEESPEKNLLDPDAPLIHISDAHHEPADEPVLLNETHLQENAESALFNGLEDALQGKNKDEKSLLAAGLSATEDKKETPKIKSRFARLFRKKSALPDEPQADPNATLVTSAPETDAQTAALIDPAAQLLNPTPTIESGSQTPAVVPSDDAPERNVVALYKSVGLTTNDIPEASRPVIQPTGENPFEAMAPAAETVGGETPQAEGKKNVLVSAIIETAKKTQEERNKVLGGEFTDQVNVEAEEAERKKLRHERFLIISRFCAGFSLLVPLCSWIVFQSVLDGESKFSSILKAENHGAIHAAMLMKKTEKESQLELVTKEITSIQEKTNNIRDNKVLKQIIDTRIDFLEIMLGVNKTTLKSLNLTPELNNAIHMLVFNSFTGSLKDDGAGVTISGTVRDPKRLSMSKLTYLIEAINGDEHLDGVQLRNFAKSVDDLGGTQSSFNFNFKYSPAGESVSKTTKEDPKSKTKTKAKPKAKKK